MAFWSTKATISLKRVKIEEKLLWGAYRKELTFALSNGTIPDPYGLPFPRIGVHTPPKTPIAIWPVHSEGPSNQKPIKNFGEHGAWAYPGTAQFFRVPPIISETGKATDFKLCRHIYGLNRNKSPLKIRERWPWALSGTPENFPGAHT